jgi:hypothetical protein
VTDPIAILGKLHSIFRLELAVLQKPLPDSFIADSI